MKYVAAKYPLSLGAVHKSTFGTVLVAVNELANSLKTASDTGSGDSEISDMVCN